MKVKRERKGRECSTLTPGKRKLEKSEQEAKKKH